MGLESYIKKCLLRIGYYKNVFLLVYFMYFIWDYVYNRVVWFLKCIIKNMKILKRSLKFIKGV